MVVSGPITEIGLELVWASIMQNFTDEADRLNLQLLRVGMQVWQQEDGANGIEAPRLPTVNFVAASNETRRRTYYTGVLRGSNNAAASLMQVVMVTPVLLSGDSACEFGGEVSESVDY